MHRISLIGLSMALTLGAVTAADLRIKVPPGMKMVTEQQGDTVEISFVPIDPTEEASSRVSAANDAASTETALAINANGEALAATDQTASKTVALVAAAPEDATTGSSVSNTNAGAGAVLEKAVSTLNFDRPLGAAPAFVALDVTPETVAHPGTPREFAASLLNGVDRKGTLQTGLALEAAPYQIFFGPQTSLDDYTRKDFGGFLTRLLYNANFSLGTTKATSNGDKAQRLAFGMDLTLYDKGDPRMNPKTKQLFDRVTTEVPAYDYNVDLSEAENNAAAKAYYEQHGDPNQLYVKGLEEIRAASWGRTSWNVAWAPTFVSLSGKAGDLKYEGLTAWTTFAYGFEDVPALQGRLQFIAHVRYRNGEEIMDTSNPTRKFEQDSLFAAGRLRWGRPDLNFSAEGAYIQIWHGPNGNDNSMRLGAVLEKKISTNLWFILSAGEDFGVGGQGNELFSLGSLRFGSADAPTFAP
jgi:hypothetical protein